MPHNHYGSTAQCHFSLGWILHIAISQLNILESCVISSLSLQLIKTTQPFQNGMYGSSKIFENKHLDYIRLVFILNSYLNSLNDHALKIMCRFQYVFSIMNRRDKLYRPNLLYVIITVIPSYVHALVAVSTMCRIPFLNM